MNTRLRKSIFALASLALMAGCAKEQPVSPETGPDGLVTLRAVQEVPGTRALIGGADSKSIFWSEGDALSVFDAESANVKFTLNGGAGTTEGSFTGRLESAPSSYVALHPYQADAAISYAEGAYKISGVTLKSEQKAVAGSFDPAAALMTALGSEDLNFKNAVGFVKVKPEFDCSKITLVSKNSTVALAGKADLSLASDGIPSVETVAEASSSISISGDIKANSTYYIAALPATLADGFRLIFTTAEGDKYRETTKSLQIKRSGVRDLGGFQSEGLSGIPYVTFSASAAQKFKMILDETATAGTEQKLGSFEYSLGGGEWTPIVIGTTEVEFGGSLGDLRMRGISPKGTAISDQDCTNITFSDSNVPVSCSGDIRTLVDWEDHANADTRDARFCWLLYDNAMLTSAPELPAMELADHCYTGMFCWCKSLTEAPALPAEELSEYCYQTMFTGCSKLSKAPALNSMNLAKGCYNAMFEECESMVTAPALPATTLAEACYQFMFYQCTALQKAPELPAAKLVRNCYTRMFFGCSMLSEVTVKVTDTDMSLEANLGLNAMSDWLKAVASSGTIHKSSTFTNLPAGTSGVPSGWNTVDYDAPAGPTGYIVFSAADAQTFNMTVGSSLSLDGTTSYFEYSTDNGANWTRFTSSVSGIAFGGSAGDLRLRGKSLKGTTAATSSRQSSIITFSNGSVPVSCTGDIRGLVDWENFETVETGNARFCFLFKGCSALTSAPALPATTLADYCYYGMFQNTSLVETPALPAKTLTTNCYQTMFYECKSLVKVAEISAETLAPSCCEKMFAYCEKLAKAPALNAMTLAEGCYLAMFQGCSALVEAPATLPAMTLAANCYNNMFDKCASLEKGPVLPAMTLAPLCYAGMFSNSPKFNEVVIKAADASANKCLFNWLGSVAATGTIYKSADLSLPDGSSGIPEGWTVKGLDEAPDSGSDSGSSTGASDHLTFTTSGSQEFSMTFTDFTLGSSEYFEYSTDKGANWTKFTTTVSGVAFGGETELWLRGKSAKGTGTAMFDNYSTIAFSGTDDVTCTGDIRTLVDWENYATADTKDAGFSGLFYECSALTSVPDLPATKLAKECYCFMFGYCTGLKSVPAKLLPATELAEMCYAYMFFECENLATAPELPAKVLAERCYSAMFDGVAFTVAPELPATTLAPYCYANMFASSKLVEAPELPVTELEKGCYYAMFSNCIALKKAPVLEAPTLKEACYRQMFNNSGITEVHIKATDISATNCLLIWLGEPRFTYTSGTIYCAVDEATFRAAASSVPQYWTVSKIY